MKYNLFLDDMRFPKEINWIELPLVEWMIVRNYNQFVQTIQKLGLPMRISFDHDLADEHYKEYQWLGDEKNVQSKGKFRYDKIREKTGYDCAKYLIEYCMKYDLELPEYFIHSFNPIGKKNIISLLESYKKSQNID